MKQLNINYTVISALILPFCLMGSANAGITPVQCPSVNMLKAIPIDSAVPVYKEVGPYIAFAKASYGTPSNWELDIQLKKATSQSNAIQQANKLLSNLFGQPKAEQVKAGQWLCEYDIQGYGKIAWAMNPPPPPEEAS